MEDQKKLAYEKPEIEVITLDEDSFLVTSSGNGGSGRVCNFDVCFGDGWSCVIDRWLFGD